MREASKMQTPWVEIWAKKGGFFLWLAGFVIVFYVDDLLTVGMLCITLGYFLSAVGYRTEAERLRKELAAVSSGSKKDSS